MKKSIKLLCCIMVFAMMLSTVILPASAEVENLATNRATSNTVKYNNVEYTGVDGVFTIEGATGNNQYDYLNCYMKAGCSYYLACEMLIPSTKTYQWRINTNGRLNTTYDSTTQHIVSAHTWTKMEGVYDMTAGTETAANVHFGPRLMFGNNTYEVKLRNFVAYEKKDLYLQHDAQTSDVSLNPTISYSFSNPLKKDLSAADFNLPVTVSKISDTIYAVSLSNLDYGTAYTLTMGEIEDVFGQTRTGGSVTFTTEQKPATLPVADNLLTSSSTVYVKGQNVTYTKDSDSEYTVNVSGNGDTIALGRVNLQPGVYVGSLEVLNVNVPGNVKARSEMYGIRANGANATRTVVDKAINTQSYTKLYTLITVSETDTTVEGDRWFQLELGVKLSGADAMTEAGSVKIKNIQLRQLQELDLDNDEYSAVVTKEGGNAALYITGPAASTVYFAAAAYNGGQMTDVKFGKTTLSGTTAASKIEIAAGEGYKLFIWDSNLKPLNTAFEVSALK